MFKNNIDTVCAFYTSYGREGFEGNPEVKCVIVKMFDKSPFTSIFVCPASHALIPLAT
jgi:hypothetical protein